MACERDCFSLWPFFFFPPPSAPVDAPESSHFKMLLRWNPHKPASRSSSSSWRTFPLKRWGAGKSSNSCEAVINLAPWWSQVWLTSVIRRQTGSGGGKSWGCILEQLRIIQDPGEAPAASARATRPVDALSFIDWTFGRPGNWTVRSCRCACVCYSICFLLNFSDLLWPEFSDCWMSVKYLF